MTIRELESAVRDHLRAALPPTVQVELMGGDIRSFRPNREDAVVLQYRGSAFTTPRPTQQRRMRFEIYVGSKSFRKDGHGGVLDLLDTVRSALCGFRFPGLGERDGMMYVESEDALYFDEKTATFWYYARYAAQTNWTP